jgi:hypothetical protein
LLSYHGLDFGRNSLKIFCSGWIVVIGCEKILSLMEKVSAASVFIWEHVCLGCGDYMADQLDLDFWL